MWKTCEVECSIVMPTVVTLFNRKSLITSLVLCSDIPLKGLLLFVWLAIQKMPLQLLFLPGGGYYLLLAWKIFILQALKHMFVLFVVRKKT